MLRRACSRFLPAAAAGTLVSRLNCARSTTECEPTPARSISAGASGAGDRAGSAFPGFNAEGYKHDTESGFSLFLQERCQRIFFVRHAEGYHNLAERESKYEPKNAVLLKENSGYVYLDPKLTPRGQQQCANLKASIRGDSVWGFDKPLDLDLVVVSPTTRTLQTAVLSLGEPDTPGAPPFIANELCREHISDAMCDGRRTVTELKREFPGVDFSLLKDNEDSMFLRKETDADVEERGRQFLMWLCGRPEQRIAVVTHSIFLKEVLSQFADQISHEDREEIHRSWVNAEMRAIMLCAHRNFPSSLSQHEEEESARMAAESEKKKKRAMWKPKHVPNPHVT